MHNNPVILEVAINGGVTPQRNPHVPLTAQQYPEPIQYQ